MSLKDSSVSPADRIPADFHSQILFGCPFQALVLWVPEPCMGLSPLTSQGDPLQLRYLSAFSAAACESGTSSFHVPALPTSLDVAFVNSWL